ncbi:MAG: DoxX family protein [Bacteroidia bacterium]
MTDKTRKIISIVVGAVPAAMVLMSAVMKFSGAEMIVNTFATYGLGAYVKIFGAIEIISLILFFYPKTSKIGFLLLCSYLGGAFATELAHSQMPMSAMLLILFWVSVFIKDKSTFLPSSNKTNN